MEITSCTRDKRELMESAFFSHSPKATHKMCIFSWIYRVRLCCRKIGDFVQLDWKIRFEGNFPAAGNVAVLDWQCIKINCIFTCNSNTSANSQGWMELGMKRLCCYWGSKNCIDWEDKADLGGTALNNTAQKNHRYTKDSDLLWNRISRQCYTQTNKNIYTQYIYT